MNYMSVILEEKKLDSKHKKMAEKLKVLREDLKKSNVRISKEFKKVGNSIYCVNAMPYISKDRDVLKKPEEVVSVRINWKKKSFEGMTTDEIFNELKQQWCWYVTVVDEEHTRNKYKNKDTLCVVFDSKEKAEKAKKIFNEMFLTAIEQDCIDEYKHFRLNPDKRLLTFDKLIGRRAYELYNMVDKGEI